MGRCIHYCKFQYQKQSFVLKFKCSISPPLNILYSRNSSIAIGNEIHLVYRRLSTHYAIQPASLAYFGRKNYNPPNTWQWTFKTVFCRYFRVVRVFFLRVFLFGYPWHDCVYELHLKQFTVGHFWFCAVPLPNVTHTHTHTLTSATIRTGTREPRCNKNWTQKKRYHCAVYIVLSYTFKDQTIQHHRALLLSNH